MKYNPKVSPKSFRRRPLGRYRYVRLRWRILFTLIDAFGGFIFTLGRLIARALLDPRKKTPKDPRRILVVQLDHMGDAVISTVLFPLLRRRYPAASLEVLCGPWNRQLFAAVPEVNRVHESRRNRFLRGGDRRCWKRLAWIAAVFAQGLRLRREKYDLAIDVRGDFPNALMLWLSGAKRRLGWNCGGGGFLLTDVAPFVHNRPEVESRLALLAAMGIAPADNEDDLPHFRPSEAAKTIVADKLAACFVEVPNRKRSLLVAVHVSAGTAAKRWPVEHWRRLLDMLIAAGARVVLVGSSSDRPISQSIRGGRCLSNVGDLTGDLDIVELAALLERADLFIGGDSGPAHLAAAVRTPALALFSGTNDSRQWRPRGEKVAVVSHAVPCSPCHREQCPRASHPCMRNIDPAAVFAAAAGLVPLTPHEEVLADDRTPATAANATGKR